MCSVLTRTPSWFSTRKLFEQKLSDLHKCTDLNQVKQLHAQILKSDLHLDLYVVPKLISAFSLCRQMPLATNAFNQVQYPNVHLYNTLIRAHAQNSQPSQAFSTFFTMQFDGLYPDNFTFPFLLKACTGNGWLPVIEMVHAQIEKFGFMSNVVVPNSLIDSYSKCGSGGILTAKKLFVSMGDCRDVVSWNSMISGFAKGGLYEEARKVFDKMPIRDSISWNTMLDGYVKAGKMDDAFKLFDAMPERNVVSWSTMLLGYCKVGDMEMAQTLFDKMPTRNLVSWTIVISGFAEKGLAKVAIGLFDQMEEAGVKLDNGAVISILAASAESGLLGLGEKIHASIKNHNFKCTTEISNALVDMYAKCGRLDIAYNVFNDIQNKDVVSWNAMLHGLAMHGHGEKALELFKRMKEKGFSPDKVTMIGVLCACSHAGLIDDGIRYFSSMEKNYALVHEIEHYGCMVDLLGRKGRLEEAIRLIRTMPMEPNVIIWGTLLGACRMHNAVELAREVLDHLVKLEPSNPGNLSMLSNIYAAAGDWDCVADVRLRMRSFGTQKPSGASSIEVNNEVHEFTVFDRSHPKSDKIYQMINGLRRELKQVACFPNTC
ncbi:pentatricopeptide repeat-containing protein At3g29230 [Cucurbita moschata]|uniref:Pentatricopeptide repeat-containing protein At3g29230 n=1 Tax=Cucurbita moschata TaxID=3662 RepID=A0A6J1EA54_CUCMO|nr:pentatricopeptide repeat-containing protein At3g29230 [Cucurbita moschata]